IKEVTSGLPVTEAMSADFITVPPDAPLEYAVEVLRRTRQCEFPVVGSAGNIVGILTRENLIRGLHSAGPQAQVASVMHANVPIVKYNASFEHAFRVMQECECPGVGVVGNDGRLVGLLTPETVGEMLMIQ